MNAPIEERAHALFSPSSAYTWISCKASTAAQLGQPDDSSEYADDGTASHDVMRWCLENKTDAATYAGRIITINGREFEVDEDRIEYVQMYVDGVRDRIKAYELTGATVTMFVEQRLSIEHITGEKGAKGTSDTVLIAVWPDGRAEICVIDLKYGRGVEVIAERNYQAMIYAEAARNEHADFYDFTNVRIVIHQPRVNPTPSEWEISPADLQQWIAETAKPAAEQGMLYVESVDFVPLVIGDFNPGEKQCRFCKAKAVCPALAQHVEQTIGADFEVVAGNADDPEKIAALLDVDLLDNDRLGLIYESLDLIDSWAKAVRGRIEHELLAGNAVPGTKLVQGRRGARQWTSTEEAESTLKAMRLKQDEMYNFKLISPTQADKLLSKESPRRWKKLEALIVQRDGSPSVAPESDKRPAIVMQPVADDFEAVDPNGRLASMAEVTAIVNASIAEAVTEDGEDLC
ncbi:DUF2800 domain-containing protein [Paraburkholderia atlantica]|uniref:DUF2800 domain-containing protein n=1 Tax=Paraburkholderia atlantica TaxID=2654982 RepID=UPI003D238561